MQFEMDQNVIVERCLMKCTFIEKQITCILLPCICLNHVCIESWWFH